MSDYDPKIVHLYDRVAAHWNGAAGRWSDLAYQQQSMDL